MIKTLHIFRHGQTEWNIIQRLQGHTDIPLNEEGRKQAATLQHYFAKNPVSLFLSSDLSRATETAQLANHLLKKPLQTSLQLRESFMGDAEGRTRQEVADIYGEADWARWNSVHPEDADFRLPGSESARETVTRVLSCLKEFCHAHDFGAAGICTHGLVLRRLVHFLEPQLKELLPVPNCCVYTLQYNLKTGIFSYKA